MSIASHRYLYLALSLTLAMSFAGCTEYLSDRNSFSKLLREHQHSFYELHDEKPETLRKAADKGDSDAQLAFGHVYEGGRGIPQDYEEAARWFRKAALQDNPFAQRILSEMYFHGVRLGVKVQQDYKEAARWYQKTALKGDSLAQLNLGIIYEHGGMGVQQDHEHAASWYTEAAKQGVPEAQYKLGIMYEQGKGVSQKHEIAVRWYRLAAKQEHAHAQYRLALKYHKGEGIPQNYVYAYAWANIAVFYGDENAREIRDEWARDMASEQITDAQNLAQQLQPQKKELRSLTVSAAPLSVQEKTGKIRPVSDDFAIEIAEWKAENPTWRVKRLNCRWYHFLQDCSLYTPLMLSVAVDR